MAYSHLVVGHRLVSCPAPFRKVTQRKSGQCHRLREIDESSRNIAVQAAGSPQVTSDSGIVH